MARRRKLNLGMILALIAGGAYAFKLYRQVQAGRAAAVMLQPDTVGTAVTGTSSSVASH